MDHVDKIIEQWNRERPDLDVAPMALIGRVKRLAQYLSAGMEETFKKHGLNTASFDVLATLRRSGKPFSLTPSELINSTMVTSGTMTNRIDQLVKAGYVERIQSVEDKRSFKIALTKSGFDKIEFVVGEHVETQKRLVSRLSKEERQQLNVLSKQFLGKFE